MRKCWFILVPQYDEEYLISTKNGIGKYNKFSLRDGSEDLGDSH